MDAKDLFQLGSASIIDVTGEDAAKVVHNLTTNEVTQLAVGGGCESFVTDVRGKTVGHYVIFRIADGLRFIGAAGQSERVISHMDRYIILEDAELQARDEDFRVHVLSPTVASALSLEVGEGPRLRSSELTVGGVSVGIYQVPWLGEGSVALLIAADRRAELANWAGQRGLTVADESRFHSARIACGFPWFGIDVDEKNLPQEADRDTCAISFIKGCYLGQETVARLDALGQVQKKLVRWSVQGAVPPVGTALTAGEKTVGRLTSVARDDSGGAVAIGMARRSHFEPGAKAVGVDAESGSSFEARVL